MRIAPSADGGETCGSAAGPAPHFLFLRRRENGPLGGPKEKNRSRRDHCGVHLRVCTGCAMPRRNRGLLPRIWQCESSFEIITRAAAEREAVPCVDHPESKTEASTCGGMLPRFYPCRTHPEEDYQSQLAPTTTTLAFAVKSTRMCRFEPPQAPFFWTVNGPFSLGATQRKWGVHSRAAKRRNPPSLPRGQASPSPPAGGPFQPF